MSWKMEFILKAVISCHIMIHPKYVCESSIFWESTNNNRDSSELNIKGLLTRSNDKSVSFFTSTLSLSLSLSLSASPEVSEGDDGISFCALVGLRFEQHEMEMEHVRGHPTPHPIQHIQTRTGTEWNTVRTGIGGKLLKKRQM